MENHATQPEELNASAKIAPCGWGPVAEGDVQCVSMPFVCWATLIDQQEHHNTMWEKSEMGT